MDCKHETKYDAASVQWLQTSTGSRPEFEAFFRLLAETSQTAHLVPMVDSIVVRAHGVDGVDAPIDAKPKRSE